MANRFGDIAITSLEGGLNDTDPPQALKDNECVVAENVEFFNSSCGERRAGSVSLSLTGSGLDDESTMVHLSQWFPTNSATSAEYLAISATLGSTVSAARRDTTGVWHSITPNDAINSSAPNIYGIVAQALDANNFVAYKSLVDRLHILDNSGNWRAAGLAQPAVPTVANSTTAGGYRGPRYFRIRYTVMSGDVILRRSEPSDSTVFTPLGTKDGAVVTKPTTIGEGETHWELEASEDDANYYIIATTAVGTTTYTDKTVASKTYQTAIVGAPVSTDGSNITYVLLSDQAAQLNLTGTVSNGTYATSAASVYKRGWIGFTSSGTYIAFTYSTTWATGQNWFASPDVAAALESAAGTSGGNYIAVGLLSDAIGAYLTIPSVKFLAVDGDRIVYGGHWTDASLASTVGWTPVKDDPGVGNSERAPIVTTGGEDITTTINLDNYDGGPLTGLAASVLGTWYSFKWQRIYSAVRTSDVTKAYDISTVSVNRGALPGSVVRAGGYIFFLDPNIGPCLMGTGGVINPIAGLRTTWKRINTASAGLVCCGLYYPYKEQVIWYLTVDGQSTPTIGIKVQLSDMELQPTGELRGGISTITGLQATARCAAALTYTNGNQTTELPFVGLASPYYIQRCDTGTTDDGTSYTATIITKPVFAAGLLNKWRVRSLGLLATADSSGSIKVGIIRNQGVETKYTTSVGLAPTGSETQIVTIFDNLDMSELRCAQVVLTDGFPNKVWEAQRIDMKPSLEEQG